MYGILQLVWKNVSLTCVAVSLSGHAQIVRVLSSVHTVRWLPAEDFMGLLHVSAPGRKSGRAGFQKVYFNTVKVFTV